MNKIKIPKVDKLTKVYINRTGIVESKNAIKVSCKKQTIEGIEIPQGYEIWIPGGNIESVENSFSSNPYVTLEAWKMNQILRTFAIDKLRA